MYYICLIAFAYKVESGPSNEGGTFPIYIVNYDHENRFINVGASPGYRELDDKLRLGSLFKTSTLPLGCCKNQVSKMCSFNHADAH